MNKKILIVFIFLFAAFVAFYFYQKLFVNVFRPSSDPRAVISSSSSDRPDIEAVVENLTIPWDVAFLPDGSMLVTERIGNLWLFPADGSDGRVLLSGIGAHRGEGGLLGIAVGPGFEENRGWIYLYFSHENEAGMIENSVWQYWFQNEELMTPAPILEGIPGASFHDGGRIEFGPDGHLYITTGDAGNPSFAQDINSLAGKVLRISPRGEIPSDNPFGNAVWSYGHRNPQGLAWDETGRLWATEHGPSGVIWPNCCQDELNLIYRGKNYGWPESAGDKVLKDTESPALHSARGTWAPAGALYWEGSIFFGGLRGEALYEAVLKGDRVEELREHFKGELGRIRTIRLGPDGMFYITTSNRDGRGTIRAGDDKIIRINPSQFR